jgi:L-lactate dehydrogenase (cytochrome)
MDPTISFDDLDIIREIWPGKIVVKGVQTVEDAKLLADRGVDGIVLSNHGGRQLDRAPIPFHLLPHVVREVGADLEVHLDTGIMSGTDIVASVALGARFTLIGRAYLYGLMAGGRRGVDKTIEILRSEIVRTMTLLEVATLDELGPQHVTQLARLTPIAKPVADAAEAAVATATKPKAARSSRSAASATSATAKAAPATAKAASASTPAKKSASRTSVTK